MEIILNKWEDSLIWCPSQCYYYFKTVEGDYKCIYLRWRHGDPWEAWLVNFTDKNMDWNTANWSEISLEKYYPRGEENRLKEKVMKIVKKLYTFQENETNKKSSLLQRLWKIKDSFRIRKSS